MEPAATQAPLGQEANGALAVLNGRDAAVPIGTDVFVGGLSPDVKDEDVQAAFAHAGELLELRLSRRRRTGECKGFGFLRFADQATAERACAEVKEVGGKPVGVHISHSRSLDQLVEEQLTEIQGDADPEASINKLLRLVRSHSDRKSAVAAALKAVLALPARKEAQPLGVGVAQDERLTEGEATHLEPIPDPEKFLEASPRCKHLVETFRANPSTHNKTPLAVLHEYATRLGLELTYEEDAEGPLGPFTVDAKLTSVGGAVLYAKGSGKGRGKKDAKQVAAAAVLEMLLVNVPESDFLIPGKAKQTRAMQSSARSALGRGGFSPLGRGTPGGSPGGRYMGRGPGSSTGYRPLGMYAADPGPRMDSPYGGASPGLLGPYPGAPGGPRLGSAGMQTPQMGPPQLTPPRMGPPQMPPPRMGLPQQAMGVHGLGAMQDLHGMPEARTPPGSLTHSAGPPPSYTPLQSQGHHLHGQHLQGQQGFGGLGMGLSGGPPLQPQPPPQQPPQYSHFGSHPHQGYQQPPPY